MAPVDANWASDGKCPPTQDARSFAHGRRTRSRVTPRFKIKYRVKNWATYEAALKKRGDVTFWFDEDAIGAWNAVPTGRPAASPATPTLLS